MAQGDGTVVPTQQLQATDAELAAAQARLSERDQAEVAEFFRGDQNRFPSGGRFDGEDPAKGMWDHTRDGQLTSQAPYAAPAVDQPVYTPPNGQVASQIDQQVADQGADADFRQKYGQALNRLGEERKAFQAQLSQLTARIADAEARAQLAAQGQSPGINPYGFTAPPPTAQATATAPPTFTPHNLFPGKVADDVVSVEEVNKLVWNQIVPTMDQVRVAAGQEAYNRAMADMNRRLGGWDVSPSEELAVLNDHPALRNLPQFDRDQLIRSQVAARRAAITNTAQTGVQTNPDYRPVGPVQAAPAPQVRMVDPRQVMRTQTFVEQRPPTSAGAIEPKSPAQVLTEFNRELDACKTSQEMELVARKYGVDVNATIDSAMRGGRP